MYTMVDGKRPYEAPFMCLVCGREHVHKTYHIRLDDSGTAIVSKDVWDRLKTLPASGFSSVNTVTRPPAQGVAMRHDLVAFARSDMEEAPGGVVIRHPTLTSQRLIAIDRETPYAAPYACAECGTTHTHKTYHIDLDHEGSALVSPQIAAVLERLGMKKDQTPEPVRLSYHGKT